MGKDNEKSVVNVVGDKLGVSPTVQTAMIDAYKIAKKFITVGGPLAEGAVEAADLLKSFFGGGDDSGGEFNALFEKIKAELHALSEKLDAVSKQLQDSWLTEVRADADTALKNTREWLKSGASRSTSDPYWNSMGSAGDSSSKAVDMMSGPTLWLRAFDPDAVCTLPPMNMEDSNPWQPPLEPGNQMVWDHRVALPAFLDAVRSRLFYLRSTDPENFWTNAREEIQGMLNVLNSVYQKLMSGIKVTGVPLPAYNRGPLSGQDSSWWQDWGKKCGVVDTYSGVAVVETFPLDLPVIHVRYKTLDEYKQHYPAPQTTQQEIVDAYNAEFAKQADPNNPQTIAEQSNWSRFNLVFGIRAQRLRQQYHMQVQNNAMVDLMEELRKMTARNNVDLWTARKSEYYSLADAQPAPWLFKYKSVRQLSTILGDDFSKRLTSGGAKISLGQILCGVQQGPLGTIQQA